MGHDDIKRANLNMIVARKQCNGAAPRAFRQQADAENREGRMPDEDDTFGDINL